MARAVCQARPAKERRRGKAVRRQPAEKQQVDILRHSTASVKSDHSSAPSRDEHVACPARRVDI